MFKTRFAGALAIVLASAGVAGAEGFPEARDEALKFTVRKKPKTWIKLESKAPAETVNGKVADLSGELMLNPAKLDSAAGTITVPLKNLDTGNKTRNQHMLSSEWMDADNYPNVELAVEAIEDVKIEKKKAEAKLKGKMKIRGVEKEVSLPVKMTYVKDKKADGKDDTLVVSSSFEIKLADYEIKGKAGVVGNKVAETVKLSVQIQLNSGEEPEKKSGEVKKKPPPPAL